MQLQLIPLCSLRPRRDAYTIFNLWLCCQSIDQNKIASKVRNQQQQQQTNKQNKNERKNNSYGAITNAILCAGQDMTMSSRSAMGAAVVRGAGEGKRKLGQGVPAADSRAGKVPLLIVALNVNFQFQLGTTKRASKNNSILLPATASVPRCVCVRECVCVVVAVVQLHNSSYNQRGKQQLLFYVAAAGQWQRQRQLQFMCDDNLLLSWPRMTWP